MKRIPLALEFDVRTQRYRWAFPWLEELGVIAYRKYDGHACLVKDERLYKRYKLVANEAPPEGWIPSQGQYGWVPFPVPETLEWSNVYGQLVHHHLQGQTCELVGAGIRGNPEGSSTLRLMPHKGQIYRNCPRDAHLVPPWLERLPIEGIVWHHVDGRMAKLTHATIGSARPATFVGEARR